VRVRLNFMVLSSLPHCSLGIFIPSRMNKIYCAWKNRKGKRENKNRGFRLFLFFIFLFFSFLLRPLYFFSVLNPELQKRIWRQFNKVGILWSIIIIIIVIIIVIIIQTKNSWISLELRSTYMIQKKKNNLQKTIIIIVK
jgi:hypothetical protein